MTRPVVAEARESVAVRGPRVSHELHVPLEHVAPARLNTAPEARRMCAIVRDNLGGNGMLLENHVARHPADVEAVYTYGGTDSVRSLIVGRPVSGLSVRLIRRTWRTDDDLSGR
jgi:glutaryl-CoA dehydrogenase